MGGGGTIAPWPIICAAWTERRLVVKDGAWSLIAQSRRTVDFNAIYCHCRHGSMGATVISGMGPGVKYNIIYYIMHTAADRQ